MPFQKELHPQESNFMKTVARHGLAKVSQQNRPKENPEYGVRQVRALKPRKCQQICFFLQNRNKPLCYTPSASYPISFSINIKHSPTTLPYSTAQVPGKNAYRPFHFVSAKAGAKKMIFFVYVDIILYMSYKHTFNPYHPLLPNTVPPTRYPYT